MSYKNIMLALCGRGDEGDVIRKAMELKNQLGANLTVVHVNDLHSGEMSMMMDSPHKFTEEEIRERLVANGFENEAEDIAIKILKEENTAQAISSVTENVDLLILGHRRQSYFKEHFFDSVDEGIVNHANCPVMVIPKE